MVSLSAFASFGKFPLSFIQKAITGKRWLWMQDVPVALCPEPQHWVLLIQEGMGRENWC